MSNETLIEEHRRLLNVQKFVEQDSTTIEEYPGLSSSKFLKLFSSNVITAISSIAIIVLLILIVSKVLPSRRID